MQRKICSSFSKFYPMVEAGLILDDDKVYTDFFDRPLLHVAEGTAAVVIFTRQTDMRHIDKCFRRRPTFEQDMAEK